MFEYIKGIVENKKLNYVVLELNEIGYKIYITLREYEKIVIGEKYKFYIYNYIREDANKFIGFLEEKERILFEELLNVKGIGLSLALAILSTFSYDRIINLIVNEDYISLKKVPKLGEKKAQFIILELKNKLKNINIVNTVSNNSNEIVEDLTAALESLGYNNKEITKVLSKIDINKFDNLENALKETLKNIKE